ncbi:MAG: phage tail sheath subtilisin-like domain-containing protein [Caldilineaceae bacterium]
MLVAPRVTYPGVYIQEVESDVRTIVGVDTSTTAFIGRTKRGPVDEPTVINSYADFEQIFGGLWLPSTLGYTVRDFFQNGGAKAVIVRLFNRLIPTPSDLLTAIQKVIDQANGAKQEAAKAVFQAAETAAKAAGATVADVLKAAQKNAEDHTVHDTQEKQEGATAAFKAATDAATPPPVNATITLDPALAAARAVLEAAKLAQEKQGDVVKAAQAKADEIKQQMQDARLDPAKSPSVMAAQATATKIQGPPIDLGFDPAPIAATANQDKKLLSLVAANEGEWGNQLTARVIDVDAKVRPQIAKTYNVNEADLFNLIVRDNSTGVIEEFSNVTVGADLKQPRSLKKVLEKDSKLVRLVADAAATRPEAYPAPNGRNTIWTSPATYSPVEDTGRCTDGIALENKNFTEGEADKKGIYALENADIFNLLCIPPFAGSDVSNMADVSKDLWDAAAAYCEKRRAILVVDPPQGWDKKQAVDGAPSGVLTVHPNAVLYFPRIKKANALRDNQIEEFAPCGVVTGIMARTDATRGVWKAPAGLDATLRGVADLTLPLTDPENGELNPLAVNCLRTMPAAGHVVWGARTTVGDDRLASQWKYLPVRRTALYIEESLFRAIQWAVFEPNDEPLWAQLRLNIGVFMHGLFRQGAFQGKSPQEAYLVQCDSSTTTQADIDKGIVNIVVGFAPLKPAEFVVIYLKQLAGQLAA